jgi:hypothetical protein
MEGQNLKIVEQARDEIIKLLADKRHEHSLYMQRCKGITASIKDWKDKAKEAGAPRVAFNGLLKFIALNDKIDALTQDMDQADAEACDFLIERLGAFADTELGEAAVRAAGAPRKTKAAKPRKTKGKVAGESVTGDVLAKLIDDTPTAEEADVRPAFLRDKETAAVAH